MSHTRENTRTKQAVIVSIRKQAVVSERYTSSHEVHHPFLAVYRATVAVRTSIIQGPISSWSAHLFLLQHPIPVLWWFLTIADFDSTCLFSPAFKSHAPRLDFALGIVPVLECAGHSVLLPIYIHPIRPRTRTGVPPTPYHEHEKHLPRPFGVWEVNDDSTTETRPARDRSDELNLVVCFWVELEYCPRRVAQAGVEGGEEPS